MKSWSCSGRMVRWWCRSRISDLSRNPSLRNFQFKMLCFRRSSPRSGHRLRWMSPALSSSCRKMRWLRGFTTRSTISVLISSILRRVLMSLPLRRGLICRRMSVSLRRGLLRRSRRFRRRGGRSWTPRFTTSCISRGNRLPNLESLAQAGRRGWNRRWWTQAIRRGYASSPGLPQPSGARRS